MNKASRIRTTMDFPPKAAERIERLKVMMECPSNIEVLRIALSLLDSCVAIQSRGGSVVLREADGKEVVLHLGY